MLSRRFAPFYPFLRRIDPLVYALFAALCTLCSARMFYGYMLKQTGGEWSAPLDDVFIHFDYARSTARGHPFEWTVGNGYSSGNTSLSYPFILALGWLVGFREERLMIWAALIAMICVFATLLAARRLFFVTKTPASKNGDDDWARLSSYLLPPVFLGVGALDWSLWSGMEVAWFLGAWALALVAWLALDKAVRHDSRAMTALTKNRAWLLGLAGACMIVTRPEAAGTIAAFAFAAAYEEKKRGTKGAIALLLRVAIPGVVCLVAQSAANRAFTGEWSANGAIVKLAVNSPFLTWDEKLADYTFNLKYAILRNTEYHFTDAPGFGMILPAFALLALAMPETRKVALMLWAQIALWLLMVAFNGQVRWQNERYTMPAVAWLLVCAALGVSAMFRKRRGRTHPVMVVALGALAFQAIGIATRPPNTAPEFRFSWLLAFAIGAALAAVLYVQYARILVAICGLFFAQMHLEQKMRDQKWFFGRACRNIRDQHTTMGVWLKTRRPRRVLVGDAGAILYASDAPGLDIIGLGGYGEYPFARASVNGLPATIELIERMPPSERPDVLAIFPTWWGVLPTWFSSEVLARFPVEGNVICGGYEHVAYKADWHVLGIGDRIRELPDGDVKVVDQVDVADLVSERAHDYEFPHPQGGWTDMHVLPDPQNPRVDMFDAGRRIAGGRSEKFTMRNLVPGKPAHLVFRTAPEGPTKIRILLAGEEVARADFTRQNGWLERAIAIEPKFVKSGALDFEVQCEGPQDFVDYHVWLTE